MTLEEKGVFLNKARFTKMVEKIRVEKNMSYIDSILYICETYKIDEADVKKYVTDIIKQKVESEAMDLNLVPRQNTLPIE